MHGGGRYVDLDRAMTALMAEDCPLTDRELEVLCAVNGAGRAADIARRVHLSPGTVRNYLSSAMQKLGVGTRLEAVERARDRGWL
ncbi:MAG: two-component system, NarL family, response regulator DesR [Pseudonocardiales bacterium]|nr:two component transcriptional regulator, LuxR family [Pseudonocardia sp.]MDT7651252.1 two-component system, NarL family, response regulator DesR [Pseudonocardiales bacterium]MDX6364780.1 two-component system, NarL family, response regulator DesR [Streptomyces sp.]